MFLYLKSLWKNKYKLRLIFDFEFSLVFWAAFLGSVKKIENEQNLLSFILFRGHLLNNIDFFVIRLIFEEVFLVNL
jgi:hypothetical protein